MIFNTAQIIYASAVIGIFMIVYGRRYYKNRQKKQEDRSHRKDWKSRF
uniref:ORF66 n=1 Tax=Nitrosopumilaceae spindle-shaped virus TaxID=3065433 RepID=A0AAT9J9J7_9VIRU